MTAASTSPACIGSASRSPCRTSTFRQLAEARPCSSQHVLEASTAMTRWTCGATVSASCPVPHPRSPRVSEGSSKPRSAHEEKVSPNISSRRRSQPTAAVAKNSRDRVRLTSEHRVQPLGVLPRRRRSATCSRINGPQPAGAGVQIVERHAVETARAIASRRHPAIVIAECFEMTTHTRLRQAQHGTELGHRQIVVLEDQKDTAARRVSQAPTCGPKSQKPYIRLCGWNVI